VGCGEDPVERPRNGGVAVDHGEFAADDLESALSAWVLRDVQGAEAVLEAVLADGTDLRLDAATNSYGELAYAVGQP